MARRLPEVASPTALARLDEAGRAEYWATLALRRTKGLGPRTIRRLLRHFGSAYEAIRSVPRWKEAGVSPSRGAGLAGEAWRVLARPEWEDCRDLDGHVLLWTDPRYPPLLRELPDAPALLYCRGDLSLLARPCMAIVGSRACSPENMRLTRRIARDLSACGVTVVSGMARGIDHAAHTGALPEQGRTIAVLGAGLNVVYPPQHRDLYRALGVHGLLISEFPPGALPEGPHFPIRNRIISGLSLGVLVVEAATRSGSLITARQALEQNRTVFAVPPPGWPAEENGAGPEGSLPDFSDSGCASLLDQGARPARSAKDILADVFPQLRGMLDDTPSFPDPEASAEPSRHPGPARPPKKNDADPALPAPDTPEGRVLDLLRRHGPLHPDGLADLLPPEESDGHLGGLLVLLEVQGFVRRLPGAIYEALH